LSNHQLHNREQPEAWSRLLYFADHVFNDSPELSAGASAMLAAEIDQLSGLELEKNFTFGLGKIMCEMAIHLQKPEHKAQLIDEMAIRLVLCALDRGIPFDEPFQPIVDDLRHYQDFGQPIQNLADASAEELPIHEKHLADILTETVIDKRQRRAGGYISPELPRAADVVGSNALSATVHAYQAYLIDAPVGEVPTADQEKIAITPHVLSGLAKPKKFTPLARQRIDEFLRGKGWDVSRCPAHFDEQTLKQEPAPIDYNSGLGVAPPLREERFGCEAMFTGRLLVDVALDIFPRMFTQASTIKPIDLAHRLVA
jgi:hypothetical protein